MKNKLIIILCFLIGISSFQIMSISATMEEGWHGYKGGSAHTGFVDQQMERTLAMQWRFLFGGDYIEPIQVWGENLYFLDRSGYLISLKRVDCSLNYKVEVAKNRQIIGMDSSDELIFIASGAGFARSRGQTRDASSLLTAVEKNSGKKIWEKKFATMMMTAPLVSNGKVYIANGMLDTNFTKTVGGHLFCMNNQDGTVVFDTEVEEYAFGMGNSIMTLAENTAVLIGMKFDRTSQVTNPPKLFAFNAEKGTQLWTESPTDENRSFGIPAIKEGYIYVMENPGFQFGGGGGGPPGGGSGPPGGGRPPGGGGPGGGSAKPEAWLLKMNVKTGKVEKTLHIENENFGSFSPTLAQDAIYINSFTGKIFCIDYYMDKIHWIKTYERFSFYTELTATRNYLFTCTYEGMLLCISKADGSIQYRYRIGSYGGIPVVSGREVFVSGEVLYCFSLDAKPLLLVEPSFIDFAEVEKGEKRQKAFRVLYTGLETLSGSVISDSAWLSSKPDRIEGNIQTFFAILDSTVMNDGLNRATLLIETGFGKKTIEVTAFIQSPPPLPLTINIETEEWTTNQKRFILTGTSEPLTSIYVNELKIFADNRGSFQHSLRLHEGKNEIEIIAKANDQRENSLRRTIFLDTIPPYLEASLIRSSENQEEWIISGKTEFNAQLSILSSLYTPWEDGTFTIVMKFPEEQTSVFLTSKDYAGNVTSKTFAVNHEN